LNNARQHHYVQARYLDGFLVAPNDKLWSYGRRRTAPFESIPDKLARQRDFYRLPNAPNGQNLEPFLEAIEKPGLDALKELVMTRQPLMEEKRINLARYIAYQEMRVPYAREINREQTERSLRDFIRRFDETGRTDVTVQNTAVVDGVVVRRSEARRIRRSEVERELAEVLANPDSHDLHQMMDLASTMTRFYSAMGWTILLARPCASFITSDCPVFRSFERPGGVDALVRADCSVLCPLSGRALLVMKHDFEYLRASQETTAPLPTTLFRTITDKAVHNFNRRIAEHSNRWTYTGEKAEWVTEIMGRASLRKKPIAISTKNVVGLRWPRGDEAALRNMPEDLA
jgi:hypothetical protein